MTDHKTDAPIDGEYVNTRMAAITASHGGAFDSTMIDAGGIAQNINAYKAIKADGGLDSDAAKRKIVSLLGEVMMVALTVTDPEEIEGIALAVNEALHALPEIYASRVLPKVDLNELIAGGRAKGLPTFVEFCESNGETPEEIRGGCQLMRSLGIPEQDITGDRTEYAPATDTAA